MIVKSGMLFLVAFLAGVFCGAKAQKLPNIQESSLRAPATIKVDGKATEWNNQFQAYNKATEIFYTISNDNDKLYLTVHATDLDIVNKIIYGGVTLTINGSGKMNDQAGMAVTFPVVEIDRHPKGPRGYPPINLDKQESTGADFFRDSVNKQLSFKAKDIRVSGITEIKEPLISIYNPESIKVAALVDTKMNFTYELAVPLKYLGLAANGVKAFVYNIKLRGMDANTGSLDSQMQAFQVLRWDIKKKIKITIIDNLPQFESYVQNLLSPTDFWGEYTLAK